MADFYIVSGDTLPAIQAQLKDDAGNIPDLTGASVQFVMGTRLGVRKITGSATIVGSPTLGTVKYAWAAGDTDTVGAAYEAQWVVTFSGGAVESFPTKKLTIAVTPRVHA